ncbi:RNA-binding domain-containing protein [Streptomyces sp. NPDC051896]|uniref:RNA-binding domain-containing protein n=1 Tax=Streptomyces sp. NPDC051896 TaxID=3155416 RepID=UPI00343BE82C
MNLSKIERLVREGDLSLDALKYLINCRGECEWLDFKQALHLDNDYGIATFTRDALAMKNTGGGYLVIGVQDKTWVPVGLTEELPYDAKLLRDKIRRGSGLDLQVDIVQHELRYTGEPRWFALVLVRAALKRRKRRMPSVVRHDFHPKESYGLSRGEIYFRKGDSTVKLTNGDELEGLLDDLEDRTDRESLEQASVDSAFAVDQGTYRLLERDFEEFVGRAQLREQLMNAVVGDPRIWIVNVHGPGGVGKSALASWVAYDCLDNGLFEAILQLTAKETVLTAGGITRSRSRTLHSLEDLLDQIAELFGEAPRSALEDKKALAIEWLSVFSTLLVLDNLETVDDGRIIAFVQDLPPSSKAKVLITSRRKSGGWEKPVTVPELNEVETKEFVEVKAAEMGIHIPLTDRLVSAINESCGGLPLAIQWFLGRYKRCGDIKAALEGVRHKDSPVLEFSFRNTWDSLPSDARRVLSVMSLFDAPPEHYMISLAADLPHESVDKALRELEDATLVSKHVDQADGRASFSSLPITLSFAANQLPQFGSLEKEARKRLNRYKQQLDLETYEVRRFISEFERYGIENDNDKRGVILCRQGESETFSGNFEAADDLFKQAREVAPTNSYVLAMSSSYELARGHIGRAKGFADAACARATRLTGSLAYSTKARVCAAQRDNSGRINALKRALEYAPDDVVLRHQYGVALSRSGQTREAIDQFTRIVDVETLRTVPSESLVMALKTRVINYRRLGEHHLATEDLAFAKSLLRDHPHLAGQSHHIAELEE